MRVGGRQACGSSCEGNHVLGSDNFQGMGAG